MRGLCVISSYDKHLFLFRYGKLGSSLDEIQDAAKSAQMHDRIVSFPDGPYLNVSVIVNLIYLAFRIQHNRRRARREAKWWGKAASSHRAYPVEESSNLAAGRGNKVAQISFAPMFAYSFLLALWIRRPRKISRKPSRTLFRADLPCPLPTAFRYDVTS